MKKHFNVGIDLDGVVINFHEAFSKLCIKEFGDSCYIIEPHMIKSWDFYEWYPITKEQQKYIFDKYITNSNEFYSNLTILDIDAWSYLKKLSNIYNVNVYFITNRPNVINDSILKITKQWLSINGWGDSNVIISCEKQAIAKALKLKFFIDDNAINCLDVNKECNCRVYMVKYPHNSFVDNIDIIKVDSIYKFVDDVLRYANGK